MTRKGQKFTQKPSRFLDYKLYLKAMYQERKDADAHYSYVLFSEDLGLGPSNVSWLIINGQRKLTRNTSEKIIEELGIKGYEKQYFQIMIRYTHAKDSADLDDLLRQLVDLKARCVDNTADGMVLKFYSQWQHAVLFEMIGLDGFNSDIKWIQDKLNFHLTAKEIEDSLAILQELGLIHFDADKKNYVKTVKDFETKAEVPPIGVVQYHKKMIDLGKSSIENLKAEHRDIGAVTVAVSPSVQERIKKEIQAFRSYLMFIASQSIEPTDIMQINIQAFSLTHPTKDDLKGSGD